MPKKRLKKVLPNHKKIKEQRFLKIFGAFLDKRELWSLSRKKIVGGVLIGVFVACLPMPLQMLLSTFLAIYFSVNLPISFALIFISNPFTMPPLFYFEYKLGNLILGKTDSVHFNFDSMYDNFDQIALSLWTGAITLGIFSGIVCAIFVNYFWIISVKKQRRR